MSIYVKFVKYKEVDGVFKKDPKKGEIKLINELSYDEMISLVNAGSKMFSKKTLEYARENNVIIEVKGLNKDNGSIISNVSSKEDILFVDSNNEEIQVVFKDMEIFNKLFYSIATSKLKLEELVVTNNIVLGSTLFISDLINE